jgi:hypothetical protein
MATWRFSIHRKVMKSLLVGIGCYLYNVYNYHDSRACGYKRSWILSILDGYWMGLVLVRVWDFVLSFVFYWTITFVFRWTTTYVFYWTLPSVDIFYLIGILGSSTFNFHVVTRLLIICESSIGAFMHLTILQLYLRYYIQHIITSCTCWVLTISVLNLAISPCCTNLLLRSGRRFGILW